MFIDQLKSVDTHKEMCFQQLVFNLRYRKKVKNAIYLLYIYELWEMYVCIMSIIQCK